MTQTSATSPGPQETGAEEPTATPSSGSLDEFRTLAASLPLPERVQLLTGQTAWRLYANEAIGLQSMAVSDGPVGVRGTGEIAGASSALMPSPSALAATWDLAAAHRAGELFASEARRLGVDVVLAPQVNIQRTPVGGRHFECYSEDPLLTSAIAGAVVASMQAHGVAACLKHFIANDSETARTVYVSEVDEQTLREVYLAPFEHLVKDVGVWSIMAADGTVLSEHVASSWNGWFNELPDATASVTLSGAFRLTHPGTHRPDLGSVGTYRFSLDGEPVASSDEFADENVILNSSANSPAGVGATITVQESRDVPFSVELTVIDAGGYGRCVRADLRHLPPGEDSDAEIAEAVAAAAGANLAVVIVGTNAEVESEGWDRHLLALPGRQDELVERVLDVAPHAVIVIYTEGVHVGHRGWERSGATPAAPFGFGLGWTSWRYDEAVLTALPDGALEIAVTVTDVGEMPGREVVQAYVTSTAQLPEGVDRPVRC